MTTMVEKVARALCAAADDDWDWSVFYIVDAKDTAETGREMYRSMARAAIEAMKPTDEMIQAGASEDQTDDVYRDVRSIFSAMIQAAIKEGQ